MPVSTRGDAERGAGGNRITFAFLRLPLSVASPLDRLRRVHRDTQELKRSGRIAGSDLLLRSLEQLPGPLKTRAAKFAASPRLCMLRSIASVVYILPTEQSVPTVSKRRPDRFTPVPTGILCVYSRASNNTRPLRAAAATMSAFSRNFS